jgi:hypothetical protein
MAVLSERFAPICTRTLLRCVEAAVAAACSCSPACLLRACLKQIFLEFLGLLGLIFKSESQPSVEFILLPLLPLV